jgi:PAP2 superfamily.
MPFDESLMQDFSGLALIGYGFYKITPNHHAFSLTDPSISYPYKGSETVTIGTLVLAALVGPAVIIFIIAVVLTPGTGTFVDRRTSRLQAIKSKAWEWIAGWMGLALALAGVWMATQGLKDLIGKPRPDMLARCNPNLSEITTYAVSGLGTHLQSAPILVSWEICQNKSNVLNVDGFSSFPSAHSSCMSYLSDFH